MLNVFIQNARRNRGHGVTSMFRHLGALGLFFLAILDSSPLPTFGGPDILTAILAASHRNPWYEYAAVATAGSVVGALLTFRVARRAGSAYLHSKFGNRKLDAILSFFHKWGTSALAASHSGTISISYKRVFRGGRCFELRPREISDSRDYLPCCSLWNHRNCRRSLWPTFHTRSAPTGSVLGLVAVVRGSHLQLDHRWNFAQ